MKNAISLNLNWKFREGFDPEFLAQDHLDGFETVHVPHTVREIPYDCFDQTMTCLISTYARELELPELTGKRAVIEFEGVSAYYDLYVNGALAGSHKGAYSTARFDITGLVHPGQNRIMLMVDSNERSDIPPNGSTVDFLIYGGIYRDVNLYLLEEAYLERFLFRYDLDGSTATAKPELHLQNHGAACTGIVQVEITRDGKAFHRYRQTVEIAAGASVVTLRPESLPEIERWDLDTPVLYDVSISLLQEDRELDSHCRRVGFRTVSVEPEGFRLNGRKIKIVGLNRHQSYPYVGYAMGKRPQQKDADILKKDLGLNLARCSHYMQSRYFLDRCDEIGLLVFEEIPGWGFIGDDSFKEVVFNDLRDMVLGHFNHPSIVIWGTRLNESGDDDALYKETNRLCKEMDPTRPTTGVRWHTGSPLFEDIYSYNDYTPPENGEFLLQEPQAVTGLTRKAPYLISEHTGPLLPIKPSDPAPQHEQFGLYHARVLSKVLTRPDYLGAIGWCMFDYNTHNDHDSANKICFHGVLDMFRVPKYAADLYASQRDPAQGIVLQPCSMVGRGERMEVVPFYVFTNCDYIEATLASDETRRYYPSIRFTGLPHPPIEVKENGEFWQTRWRGATIVGFVDGKEVARCTFSDNPHLDDLVVEADDTQLYCDRVDETRIVCTYVDENGNRLLHHTGVAAVQVEGDLELIGPDILPTMGGTVAFWVKTKPLGNKGTAKVRIKSTRRELPEKTVTISLI